MKKKLIMILACSMVIGSIFVMASEVEETTEVTAKEETQDLNEVKLNQDSKDLINSSFKALPSSAQQQLTKMVREAEVITMYAEDGETIIGEYTVYDTTAITNYIHDENNSETIESYMNKIENPETYLDYLAVNIICNAPNGSQSTSYDTTSTYDNERVFFENTTSVPVTVTESFNGSTAMSMTVPANSSKFYTGQALTPARRTINVRTQDGRYLTGTLQVRVSDVPLQI